MNILNSYIVCLQLESEIAANLLSSVILNKSCTCTVTVLKLNY